MTTQAEKLQAGIESLTWRIAALADRLPTESTNRGDDPRATVRQINEYTRAKRALQAELEALIVPGAKKVPADEPSIFENSEAAKVKDHTRAEDVTARTAWWKPS